MRISRSMDEQWETPLEMAWTRARWRVRSQTASHGPGSSSADLAQSGHRPRSQRVQWMRLGEGGLVRRPPLRLPVRPPQHLVARQKILFVNNHALSNIRTLRLSRLQASLPRQVVRLNSIQKLAGF